MLIILQERGQRLMNFPDEAGETLPRLYFVKALEQLKAKINPSAFNLGIVTDSHFDEGTWRTQAYRSLKNLNNILYIQNDLDAIAALGDNVDSEHKDKSINIRNLERYCERFSQGSNSNKFIVRGNHDAGTLIWDTTNEGNKVFEKDILTGAEQLAIFKKYLDQNGKVYDTEGQYHYKDFHEKKIRLVIIDTLDNSMATNANGTLKYTDQWIHGLREQQLKWISEKALGTLPEDYHVIMATHVPIQPDGIEPGEIKNGDLLKQLISAFVSKTSTTLVSALEDYTVNLSVDFSNRHESNFIGFFAGHKHAEYFYTPDQMGGFYSTVLDCAFVRDDSKIGTVQEDAFVVVSVDTENRKVTMLGFGRESSREYNY
ncbi:metallophosphoesterase family protein [Enterococcus durans]|uniref:metallophosphoesterase family protein n=1 Tax=Enterococcus durans TaxID=53345 RepID=UPI001F0452C6|nr:metallophosphoesterase [Enterococcus durans]